MDTITAVALAFVGIGGTLLGALVNDFLTRRREREAQAATERRATADRLRERRIADLHETRSVLEGQLAYLERLVVLGRTAPEEDLRGLTRYNTSFVGDPDAVREFNALIVELIGAMPLTSGQAVRFSFRLPRAPVDLDADLLGRCSSVRSQLLAALDAQEERALRDEPLRVLTTEEIAAIPGPEALLALLRDRRGRRSGRKSPADLQATNPARDGD